MKKIQLAVILLVAAGGGLAGFGAAVDADSFQTFVDALPWRNIGPANMGGRINDFAVVESSPSTFYAATASAGIWKTVNNGITFEPIFEHEAVNSIGDIAVAPSNPSILWVGTGEPNNRQSSSWGNGVYRSTDAGSSFQHMGLEDTHHIGRVVIHPRDPNTVYVAAVGHLWGANEQRGVFKTTDGGRSWDKVLYINEDTGVIDIAIDPESPNILYAAAYQRRRTPFGFSGGGPGSGLFRTTDAGDNWQRLSEGLPQGVTGRIGLDIYRADPRIVYATVEHAEGGTFRSDNRGETWTKMSDNNPRPMYYSQIRIDPNNDQRLWVAGASMTNSDDGGRTFVSNVVRRIHGDHHAIWINPEDSNHMLLGSDGGIHLSYDRGRSWDFINTIPLAQFYEIGVDMREPYYVYGGLQDNGSWGGPSRTTHRIGITNDDWFRVGGGDGFYVQVIPDDPMTLYVESQNGNVSRLNLRTGESKRIRPQPPEGEEERYRFDWNSPIHISPHDSNTVYYGGSRLFISRDRGDTWTRTEDLSRNQDRSTMEIMGVVPRRGEVPSANDGTSNFGEIITVSESPVEAGVLYVGTDDGNLQVSRDGGQGWTNVAAATGVPDGTYVSRVVASSHQAGRVYATFDGHRSDDFRPYVVVSEDYGATWRMITDGMASGHTPNVIREHHRNPNLLFVGTEMGLYASLDRGARWYRVGGQLPNVPVDDIVIHPRDNDLVLGTHGRGVWIADDITPLEELSEAALNAPVHLFPARKATHYRIRNHKGNTGHKMFIASNPPAGALLHFTCNQPQEKVSFEIRDGGGEVVRSLDGPCQPGYNRLSWNLRHDSPLPPPPESETGGRRFGGMQGPRVLPGSYTIAAKVGSTSSTQSIEVTEDPRLGLTPADLKAHHEALMRMSALVARGQMLQRKGGRLDRQLRELNEAMENADETPSSVRTAAEAVSARLREMGLAARGGGRGGGFRRGGGGLRGLSGVTQAYQQLSSYTERPLPHQLAAIETAAESLQKLEADFQQFLDNEVKDLNESLRDDGLLFQLKP